MLPEAHGTLDVRTMRTLLVLLTECSVSRTAEIIGQAQPTVSLTLKKLRELLHDPLLVRSGNGYVPSEKGLELRDAMRDILQSINSHLVPAHAFEANTSTRTFRIVATNCLSSVFLPPLIASIGQSAPGVNIVVMPMPGPAEFHHQLADGTIDAVIGNWPEPPQHLRIAPLLETDVVCVMRSSHRLARRQHAIPMEDYLREGHISPTPTEQAQFSPIDGRLAALGLKRDIKVCVPEYAISPYVLAQSDLLFTTGRPFAEQIAQTFPFAVVEAPPEFGPMQFYLLWHDCKHDSAAHIWLRQMIRQVAAGIRHVDPSAALRMRTSASRVAG
jgi:DNA-binding transcriptional LysR family regulator